jgi:hypothetical protein
LLFQSAALLLQFTLLQLGIALRAYTYRRGVRKKVNVMITR